VICATFAASVQVDERAVSRYIEATLDDPANYGCGTAPPMFALVLIQRYLDEAGAAMMSHQSSPLVIHSDQELRLTRSLRLGEHLNLAAELDRAGRRGPWSEWALSAALDEEGGRPVVRSRATLLTPTMEAVPQPPSRAVESPIGTHPRRRSLAADIHRHVSEELLDLYIEASGDRNPIHVSDSAAQAVGLPGRIVHGLMTLAIGAAAAVQVLGSADPSRMRYVRCRFSRTVAPGSDLTYRFYTTEGVGLYDFAAVDGDDNTVLKRACLQL
jgi:acyl dehydratase